MADAANRRCHSSVEEVRGSKRGYVTLAQSNDKPSTSNDDDDAVVVGVRVSRKVVRRSGLLAGIKDTEGLASLPAGLCPQDVKLWETACTFNIETRVDELVTILQVCCPPLCVPACDSDASSSSLLELAALHPTGTCCFILHHMKHVVHLQSSPVLRVELAPQLRQLRTVLEHAPV